MSKKAIFFLYHYNDIDHIVPIIYKYATEKDAEIYVILHDSEEYLKDYRIEFLRTFDSIHIHHMNTFTYTDDGDSKKKIRSAEENLADQIIPTLMSVGGRLPTQLPKKVWWKSIEIKKQTLGNRLYDYREAIPGVFEDISPFNEGGFVALDWISSLRKRPKGSSRSALAERVVQEAEERGLTTVSLPHGDAPYSNVLFKNDFCQHLFSDPEATKKSLWESVYYPGPRVEYDYVVAPNELVEKRYWSLNQDQVEVLGSPRYNHEWIDILSDLCPTFDSVKTQKLRVVLFTRGPSFSISIRELVRAIRIIDQFEDTFLIIKTHTRNENSITEAVERYADKALKNKDNLVVVNDNVHSESLLQWGDIFIGAGTSIEFEAPMRDKPVLALEYLHANRSTIAHYFEGSELRCRDDLYRKMKAFVGNPDTNIYEPDEQEVFVEEIIGGTDVLDRYVKFLDDISNGS